MTAAVFLPLALFLAASPCFAAVYAPACGVSEKRFADRGDRFAVLVSINEYEQGSTRQDLVGPGNDMERLCRVLKKRHGFANAGILRLHGPTATRAGILAGLDALAERSQAGRILLFAFAGHGSHVPDNDDEEPDGKDETLCPWDGYSEGDLRDDQVNEKLTGILAGGGQVVTIFDSCHSGSATRGAAPGAGEVVLRKTEPSPAGAPYQGKHNDAGGGIVGALAQNERMVLISAASDHELAKELDVRVGGGDRVRHGAFSHALLTQLEEARPGASWEEVLAAARATISGRGGPQTPQFAGNLRLATFGLEEVTKEPHFVVTEVRSDTLIEVSAGQAQGLEREALLSVYAPGTKALSGREGLVGIYRVTEVKTHRLVAELAAEATAAATTGGSRPMAQKGSLVVVLEPGASSRRVWLDPASLSQDWRAAMTKQLALVPLVEAMPEGGDQGLADFIVYRKGGAGGCIVVEGAAQPWSRKDCRDMQVEAERDVVQKALVKLARWERVLAIDHDQEGFSAADLVEVDLLRYRWDGQKAHLLESRSPEPETGQRVFQPKCESPHCENAEEADIWGVSYASKLDEGKLFVTVLYLSNDGGVGVLNGSQSSQALVAGKAVELRRGQDLRRVKKPCGTDYVKLFVTERNPVDGKPFEQDPLEFEQDPPTTRGSSVVPPWVGRLLGKDAASTRGGERLGQSNDRWSTLTIPFQIKGKGCE